MAGQEDLYREFRQLITEKEIKQDSFYTGQQIEKSVNLLIKGIVSPFEQEIEVEVGKKTFDGRVKIGRGRSLLYEILVGNLSEFRYMRLLELIKSTYLTGKTFMLTIARSLSERDNERIRELVRSIDAKKVQVCFIDYETLISLHRYSSNIRTAPGYEDLKTLKGLFLERLFEYRPVISEGAFDEALSFAKGRYAISIERYAPLPMRAHVGYPRMEYEFYESKLHELEELLGKALSEIQKLRDELRKRRLSE